MALLLPCCRSASAVQLLRMEFCMGILIRSELSELQTFGSMTGWSCWYPMLPLFLLHLLAGLFLLLVFSAIFKLVLEVLRILLMLCTNQSDWHWRFIAMIQTLQGNEAALTCRCLRGLGSTSPEHPEAYVALWEAKEDGLLGLEAVGRVTNTFRLCYLTLHICREQKYVIISILYQITDS